MPRSERGVNEGTWLSGLQSAKAARLTEINIACDAALAAVTSTYPAGEVSTFYKQEEEALAYNANSAAETPLLSALALARGITRGDLVQRVLAKSAAFAVVSGALIGQRQAKEDALNAATSIDQVQAVSTSYSMPEV